MFEKGRERKGAKIGFQEVMDVETGKEFNGFFFF